MVVTGNGVRDILQVVVEDFIHLVEKHEVHDERDHDRSERQRADDPGQQVALNRTDHSSVTR